ncbi:MAG: B3/B4 domain-containing protein, partial [Nitrososphaerales archaeon]
RMRITEELSRAFSGLRVKELELKNLSVRKSDQWLEEFKKQKQAEIRQRVSSLEEVKSIPLLRAYRDFYWKVGIDPTKTRPAGEALIRRILGGKGLPTINTLVDAYNIASAESSVAIAAFDISLVAKESLMMRLADNGESFLGIGMNAPIILSGVEVVIEDEKNKKLIAIYPYRDSAESKVTENTHDALLLMCGVPGINDEDLARARALSERYIKEYCSPSQNSFSSGLRS